jgi:signal transduction histidine kinase
MFDASGRPVTTTARLAEAPPINVADRAYFVAHAKAPDPGLYIGAPVQGRNTRTWFIPVSRGIWRGGEFLGVINAAVDPAYFASFYKAIDVGRHGLVSLLEQSGALVARAPLQNAFVGTRIADSRVLATVAAGTSVGTIEDVTALDQVRRIVSFRRVHDTGLVVTVGYAVSDVLAGWYRTLWYEGGAALLLAVLGGFALIFLIRNLNQQRRIEDLRVESESFARASEAKTAFLANMSHELRTPLNAVLGFAQLMQGEVFGSIGNVRYRQYIDEIVRSGDHLLRLLNDVLDLSHIDAARMVLEEKGFPLARLLGDARAHVAAKAKSRRVAVAVDDGVPGAVIRADLRRLTHAIANLLDNAVKFTVQGGRVELRALAVDGGAVAIRVTDEGPGMTEAEAELALRPWERRSSATAARDEGSGLGLPLAKSVAELHGGSLRFVNRDGPGLMAEILLPADRVIAIAPDLVVLPGAFATPERQTAFRAASGTEPTEAKIDQARLS